MSAAEILALLTGVLGAAPELLALFQKAQAGTTVSQTDVANVLSQYGIARAVLVAAIASAEAKVQGISILPGTPSVPSAVASVSGTTT